MEEGKIEVSNLKEKKTEKNELRLKDLWDCNERSGIYVIRVSESKKKERLKKYSKI